ncbi:TPA: fimbrial protein [Serratia fonticola]
MIALIWRSLFLLPPMMMPMAQAADVIFNISGSIKNGSCTVTSGNNQKVDLGMYSTQFLDGVGKVTPLKPFEIILDNCPINYSGVQVSFVGEENLQNTQLIAVQSGGAKNVGIALYDDDKITVIPVNSMTLGKNVSTSQATTFTFYAAYMATGEVTEGHANADISFTISYN